MRGEAEQAPLVVRPRNRVPEAGERGNPVAEHSDLRAKVQHDRGVGGAGGTEVLAQEQPRLGADVDPVADYVDIGDQVDPLEDRSQLDVDVGGDPLASSTRSTDQQRAAEEQRGERPTGDAEGHGSPYR